MTGFKYLLALSALFFGVANSSPLSDPQLRAFLNEEKRVHHPFPLARRSSTGIQTRHLRPTEGDFLSKRDSISGPDVGQQPNFNGEDPQPIRGSNGATFLGPSNHLLDEQNLDNVAGPPTDQGRPLDH